MCRPSLFPNKIQMMVIDPILINEKKVKSTVRIAIRDHILKFAPTSIFLIVTPTFDTILQFL